MKLTVKQAIDISIELWRAMVETGLQRKEDWEGWSKYGHMRNDCPLCQYMRQTPPETYEKQCPTCPYAQTFGSCMAIGSPYNRWDNTRYANPEAAGRNAKDFLLQLYELRLSLPKLLTMEDWADLAEEMASPSEESLAQQALNHIEKVMNFEEDEPDLDADASLQDIIDAFVAAHGAILAELDC